MSGEDDRCLGQTRAGARCRRRASDGGFCAQHVPEASGAVSEAAKRSRVDGLVALRDRLAAEIDKPGLAARDLAPLVRRLEVVLSQLDVVAVREADVDGDLEDELERRRMERQGGVA